MGNNEQSERDNRYRSIGTIQVRMRREKDGSDLRKSIGFTPIDDYSAKHKGKRYALFFRKTKGGADCISRVLPDSGGGVKIAGAIGFPDLMAVANAKSSVEIEVCAKGIDAKAGLSLVVSGAPTPPGFQREIGVKAQGSSRSMSEAGWPAAMASSVALR